LGLLLNLRGALGDATLSAGRWRNCTTWRGAVTMCLSFNQQGNDHFGPPPCCGVGPLAAFRRTRSVASPVLAVCKSARGQNQSTFYSEPAVNLVGLAFDPCPFSYFVVTTVYLSAMLSSPS
jgi:hypothetical protein